MIKKLCLSLGNLLYAVAPLKLMGRSFFIINVLLYSMAEVLALTSPLLAAEQKDYFALTISSTPTPTPLPVSVPSSPFEAAVWSVIDNEFSRRDYIASRSQLIPLIKEADSLMARGQSSEINEAYCAAITMMIAMQDYKISPPNSAAGGTRNVELTVPKNKDESLTVSVPEDYYTWLAAKATDARSNELTKSAKLVYYSLMDQNYIEKQVIHNPRQEIWNLAMGNGVSRFEPAAFMLGRYFSNLKPSNTCMNNSELTYKRAAYFWYNTVDSMPEAKTQAALLREQIEAVYLKRFDAAFIATGAIIGLAGKLPFIPQSEQYVSYFLMSTGIGVTLAWQISKNRGLRALDVMARCFGEFTPSPKLYID
jgi:hypothetical protein